MRVTLVGLGMGVGQSLFSLSVTLVILGYGGWLVIHGQATLGTLLAMQSLFGLVFTPSGQMVGLISGIQKSLASADRVYAFLALTPRVGERPEARSLINPLGRIRFEDVKLRIRSRPIGASTRLIHGYAGRNHRTGRAERGWQEHTDEPDSPFYDAGTGRVLLDDVDVRELSLAVAAQPDRDCVPGHIPVRRLGPRQHHAGSTRLE